MTELATAANDAEIKQWLKDYGLDTTVAKVRKRRLSKLEDGNPAHITFIESGVGYAEVSMRPDDIQVSSIFPEGVDVVLLQPSLDKCFVEAAKTRSLDTHVWARFFGGKDARGKPDQGESKCWAWHRLYPKTELVKPENPGGLWEIRAKLGDLI